MSACFRASSFTLRALKISERSIKHFGTLRRRRYGIYQSADSQSKTGTH